MAIPSLRKIYPLPSTTDYTFKFDVSGISQQIFYNELIIKLSSDTSQIKYSKKIQEFRYQHTLTANTLVNGEQYVAIIRVYNYSNELIGESNPIFFYCLSLPQLGIPTIVNGEVGNQTVLFQGTYFQAEGELLESYRFILYDDNKMEIGNSRIIYDTNLQYEFSELENRLQKYIEMEVSTVNGMVHSTGLIPFTPRYIAPRFNSAIELENLHEEASISVKCNIIRIVGIPDIEPLDITSDNKIDLRENGIWFTEGFDIKGNWTIQMWLQDIVPNSVFFKLTAKDGSKVELEYRNNKINLYKMLDNEYIAQVLLGDLVIYTTNQTAFICINHINGMFDFHYETVVV